MPLIAVSGSQGSGKSTLLNELGYPTVTRKTSRSILSDWGVSLSQVNNNRELTIRFQDEMLLRKISDEAAAVTSSDITFTERTYADLFVYALVAIGKDNEYSDWLDSYYERCRAAQQGTYAHTLYLAAGYFQPVNDGVRAVNTHYSHMVDVIMLDYTQRMTTDLSIIDVPNLSDRVAATKLVVDRIITSTNKGKINE